MLASGESSSLPDSATPDQEQSVVEDTVRLLGEDADGTRYYVAEGAEVDGQPSPLCLIADGWQDGPLMGCSRLPIEIGSGATRARLQVDYAMDDSDAGERIGDYLVVFSG